MLPRAPAARFGVSELTIGLTIVTMRHGHVGMSVGNVVGSSVFNVLGILGIASILSPLAIGGAAIETLAWLTLLTVLLVAALWSEPRLSRVEGARFVRSEVARWCSPPADLRVGR